MARELSLSLPLSALRRARHSPDVARALSATESTPQSHRRRHQTPASLVSEREPVKGAPTRSQPLTLEEMREYDANEGRCDDDGGTIRDVGTVDAYCSFPARSNDFRLIESSHEQEPAGEEE